MTTQTHPFDEKVILRLDADKSLFDKLHRVSQTPVKRVEICSSDPALLTEAIQCHPQLEIGAGQIITTQELEDCYTAGVKFATSPGFLPSIAQTALIYSMDYLPGVFTVSEAMQAMTLGYTKIRPFPGNLECSTVLSQCLPNLTQFPCLLHWEDAEAMLEIKTVAGFFIHESNYPHKPGQP